MPCAILGWEGFESASSSEIRADLVRRLSVYLCASVYEATAGCQPFSWRDGARRRCVDVWVKIRTWERGTDQMDEQDN